MTILDAVTDKQASKPASSTMALASSRLFGGGEGGGWQVLSMGPARPYSQHNVTLIADWALLNSKILQRVKNSGDKNLQRLHSPCSHTAIRYTCDRGISCVLARCYLKCRGGLRCERPLSVEFRSAKMALVWWRLGWISSRLTSFVRCGRMIMSFVVDTDTLQQECPLQRCESLWERQMTFTW